MILLEKPLFCLGHNYLATKACFLGTQAANKRIVPHLVLTLDPGTGWGLKGASGMTSFDSEAKFLSAPCFCA